jgi:hypothetical protein
MSLSLLVVGAAFAGYSDKHFKGDWNYCDNSREYKINQRLDRQRYRIEQGFERERLTYKEARILNRKHHKIRHLSSEY